MAGSSWKGSAEHAGKGDEDFCGECTACILRAELTASQVILHDMFPGYGQLPVDRQIELCLLMSSSMRGAA